MFKTRIITALFMLVGFLAVILFADRVPFLILILAVVAVGAFEWAKFCFNLPLFYWLYTASVCLLSMLVWLSPWVIEYVFASSVVWLFSPLLLRVLGLANSRALLILPGLLFLSSAFVSILTLRWNLFPELDWYLLLSCLLVVWCADSFAYFAGKRFGKHRLAPSISPGKTWEGVAGGLLGVAAVSAVFWWFLSESLPSIQWWLVICLITGIYSVLGDLMESVAKRIACVKDSGNILPGHGGVLDRIDGVLSAAPIFLTLLVAYQWLS